MFRRILFITILTIFGFQAKAQKITKANFKVSAESGLIRSAQITINSVVFRIASDGSLSFRFRGYLNSQTTEASFQNNEEIGSKDESWYQVDYYDKFDREEKMGKVKTVNGIKIDYYDIFDRDEKLGKVKSIGNLKIDYYDIFDRSEKLGKIKLIGDIRIDYYEVFDGQEKQGKVKTIGNIKFDYFDSFDDRRAGRLRSITGNNPSIHISVDR